MSVGWTLQELLAPKQLVFFDYCWREIGSKESLIDRISDASGINQHHLEPDKHRAACVAVKMSWFSKRETRYPEDMSYCMLGIFGVTMNINYSQGSKKTFRLLQEEILKVSADETIFAYNIGAEGLTASGLLAAWPPQFATCSRLESVSVTIDCRLEPTIEAHGISIKVPRPSSLPHYDDFRQRNHYKMAAATEYNVPLSCAMLGPAEEKRSYVQLRLIKNPDEEWRRDVDVSYSKEEPTKKGRISVFVPHDASTDGSSPVAQLKRSDFERWKSGWKAALSYID